ncbi:MAG: hypothetical protein ABA06_00555 [Parcubacteria bacterium C7867-001]|nr:MAG: hypothetical protein ABA06_00555 [Parcubacteria bacterium C7867-001]
MDASSTSNVVVPSFVVPPSPWSNNIINGADVIAVILAIIFIWWAVYTLIAVYHWFRFGRHSWIALPAIVAHLFVTVNLLFFITSGLH